MRWRVGTPGMVQGAPLLGVCHHTMLRFPMSVVAIVTLSERTWGRLFALVPRLSRQLTCTPGNSHNAVAEQHIKPYSLQCDDTRCYFSIEYRALSLRSIRSGPRASLVRYQMCRPAFVAS